MLELQAMDKLVAQSLASLHEATCEHLHRHMVTFRGSGAFVCTSWRLFLFENPLGAGLKYCMFVSSSLRSFFFMLEIMGALLLAAVFFSGSSTVPSKKAARLNCDIPDTKGHRLGRLLAVGVASLLVSSLPVSLLESMHTREFKRLRYRGCPEWRRQLKAWRAQGRIIVTLGSLYLVFAIFFICLFLANVSDDDSQSWAISGVFSIMNSLILVPFCIAIVLPLLAKFTLIATSCASGVCESELLRRRHAGMMENNLTLPIISI